MDMPLDLSAVENIAPIVTCTIEGIVEVEDLAWLSQALPAPDAASAVNAPAGATAGDLKRVKERHHSAARLVASGLQQNLVAEITGFSPSYLSTLLNSPAMQELVAFYRSQNMAAHEVVEERLRTLALSSIEQLQERVDGGEADDNTLIQAAKLGFDRSGHGPRSTVSQINETHLFDHAELARLNRAAREHSRGDIIQLPASTTATAKDSDDADD